MKQLLRVIVHVLQVTKLPLVSQIAVTRSNICATVLITSTVKRENQLTLASKLIAVEINEEKRDFEILYSLFAHFKYQNIFLFFLFYNLQSFISENLQYLRLGDNNLHSIPSDALRRLHRLRHLDLRSNNITILPEDAFTGYGDSITFLNLQKNL